MSITRILLIVRNKEKTRVRSKEKTRKEKTRKEKTPEPRPFVTRTPNFRNANPELFIENPELPSCESPESTRNIHKYSHSVP